jgi:4'-phosphopantetheinyl transferase
MKVFYFNITPLRNKNTFAAKAKEVSKERLEKIEKLKKQDDKFRCLGAGLLLNYVKKVYGIDDGIMIAKNGKPHFKKTKLSFNISHSGNYVIIAVSDYNVGIDIQRMEKRNQLVAEKNFCSSECAYINENDNEDIKRQRFHEIWTIKEAYLKNIGIGLRKPLNSFEIDLSSDQPKIIDNPGYAILQLKLDSRYIIAICSDIRDKEFSIEEVELPN